MRNITKARIHTYATSIMFLLRCGSHNRRRGGSTDQRRPDVSNDQLKQEWGNAEKQYIISEIVGHASMTTSIPYWMSRAWWMVRLNGLRAAECRFSLRGRSCIRSGIEPPHKLAAETERGAAAPRLPGRARRDVELKREWLNVLMYLPRWCGIFIIRL